jgi:uncharacterized Zn-finger protein
MKNHKHEIECQEKFSSSPDLEKQSESAKTRPCQVTTQKEANPSVRECRFCGKAFKSRLKMRAHSMRHETDNSFVIKCVEKGCKETFSSAAVLKKHVGEHRNVSMPFACDFPKCNIVFVNKLFLGAHKRELHTQDLCDKHISFVAQHLQVENENQLMAAEEKLEISEEKLALVCKIEPEDSDFVV